MSRHWRPEDGAPVRPRLGARRRFRLPAEVAAAAFVRRHALRWTAIRSHWRASAATPLPQGGAAGLLLVAAACAGIAIGAYHLLGPRDVFASDPSVDWNAIGNRR